MANRVLGLYVGPNQLEGPQDGAYQSLQNCVIKDKDVVEPRFGVSTSTAAAFGGANSDKRVSVVHPSSLSTGFVIAGTGTGANLYSTLVSTALATNVPPPESWLKTRFADARGRCYFTSDAGLKRIDSDSSVAAAGGLQPITGGGQLGRTVYDSSGFLAANSACMYRALLVRKDALKTEIVGPPSGRAVIRCQSDRTINIGGAVRSGSTITVTTSVAHGFTGYATHLITWDAADTGAGEYTTGSYIPITTPSATTLTITDSFNSGAYSNTVAATITSGPAKVQITVYLDSGAAAGDIIRLYRSEQVTPATAQPSEDVYQVYEALLTSTNISNGYVTITDNTPEVLLGEPAYFSPSVEGEAGSNEKPPRCVDVASVAGSLVGVNLRYPHTLDLRLLATGGSAGVVDGTTITITDGTSPFTVTAENGTVGAGEFQIHDGDTVARDIERTAQSLVDGINKYASNTIVTAHYVSGATDAPGMIRLVKRDYSTTGFTVTSDKGTAWSPQILDSGTATASTQEKAISSVAISKPGIPDAFPPLSRYEVGEPNEKALRVLPIRDNKGIIIKERSAWLQSGVWPNIRIDLIDDVLAFPFPNTAASLDGMVYVLSSVGVVAINESGVSSVGVPISGFTEFLESEELNFTTAQAWGAVDKALGLYLLFIGTKEEPDTTSRCFVYSPSARAWAGPWNVDWTAYGRLISTGLVCVGLPDVPRVAFENTAGADARGTVTKTVVTKPSVTEIEFADVSDLSVGDQLRWTVTIGPSSTVRRAIITSISGTTVTINVSHLNYFTDGVSTVSVSRGFECIAEPVPLHGGGNGADSQLRDVELLMDKQSFQSATVSIAGGDVGQAYTASKTLSRWGWGDGTWGSARWGDYDGLRPERCKVPLESQRAPFHSVRFRIREAGAKWRLHGIQMTLEQGSVKGRK
jgi:hypothetical protein